MQVEGHVADFIEKQGAALGLFKTSAPLRLGPCERAALVTKEFGFQQIFGNGRRVDGDERALRNGRMLVQRPRHEFLARAGFTGDQHRDLALAQAPDGAKHVLHGACLAQHLGREFSSVLRNVLALAFLNRAADQLHRLGQIKGLGKVFEGPTLEGRNGAVEV